MLRKTKAIRVLVDEQKHTQIKMAAERQHYRTLSGYITDLIERDLQARPAPTPPVMPPSARRSQLVTDADPKPVRSLSGITDFLLAIDIGNTNVHFGLWIE